MKLFVTWSPYDFSSFLEEFVDGFSVPLGSLDKHLMEKSMLTGLRKAIGTTKEVIVDSLLSTIADASRGSLISKSQYHIFNIQLWLNPDYIVHKDYPILYKNLTKIEKRKLLERTILNAEITLKLIDKYDINDKNVIFVIQGWNEESFRYCAKRYADMGVKMYGLGSSIKTSPSDFIKRLRIVREAIGDEAYLHVFGALKPSVLKEAKTMCNSVDTSTPFKAAAMGYVMILEEGRVKRIRVDNASLEDLHIPHSLQRELEKVINELGSLSEGMPPITRLKRVLAAVNVYTLRCALR